MPGEAPSLPSLMESGVKPADSASDVTRQRRLSQLLAEASELARVGGWEYDLRDRTLEATPEYLRIFEATREDIDWLLKHAETLHPASSDQWDVTLERTTRTGRRLWVRSVGKVVREDGIPVRLLGVAQDITTQRTMELRLAQAQKMEAIGQLAAGIAHDFNNVLTAIDGYAGILLQAMPDADPLKPDVEEITRASARAAALTRRLMTFSRTQVLQPTIIDLNTVVDDATQLLRRLIGADVRLTTQLDPALPPVKADITQMEQVIINLAVNARDAMPNGGNLDIETRLVELDERSAAQCGVSDPGRYVMLAVSDTGVGMDAATMARVFEPFFTTKPEGRGTGLGLATVYGILEQSRGYINPESVPGKGTTFRVYLPAAGGRVLSGPGEAEPRWVGVNRGARSGGHYHPAMEA